LTTAAKTSLKEIDPWIDRALASPNSRFQGSSELHLNYFNNAFDYVTPEIVEGLTGNGWVAKESNDSTNPLHNTGTLKSYTGGHAGGVGLKFFKGPLFVAADYINIDADLITQPVAGLTNGHGWQVAARYPFGALAVGAFYEDVHDLGLGKNTYVNGIYSRDDTWLAVSYGMNQDAAVYRDNHNWNVGVKHWLTKKVELQAGFNQRREDRSPSDVVLDTYTVGMNVLFGE